MTPRLKSALVMFLAVFAASFVVCGARASAAQPPQDKDYLTSVEADKIRDAETTNDRIVLFINFADDRLKKFQYELDHPASNRHADMLNYLLNSYAGCLDDAADLVQLGIHKQENIRKGIELMAAKAKEFAVILNKLSTEGNEREIYKENLDDAIEGTNDALKEAEQAKMKVAPPPVRRKN